MSIWNNSVFLVLRLDFALEGSEILFYFQNLEVLV